LMNLPSCQIFSVFGMGIGWLRMQKISKSGYVGRVEQGWRGVNRSRVRCVEVGCSNLDGREEIKTLTQSSQRKTEDTPFDPALRDLRMNRAVARFREMRRKKTPQMNADKCTDKVKNEKKSRE
jgi:hypothetical protein